MNPLTLLFYILWKRIFVKIALYNLISLFVDCMNMHMLRLIAKYQKMTISRNVEILLLRYSPNHQFENVSNLGGFSLFIKIRTLISIYILAVFLR